MHSSALTTPATPQLLTTFRRVAVAIDGGSSGNVFFMEER
jgi:hypothetical protein